MDTIAALMGRLMGQVDEQVYGRLLRPLLWTASRTIRILASGLRADVDP